MVKANVRSYAGVALQNIRSNTVLCVYLAGGVTGIGIIVHNHLSTEIAYGTITTNDTGYVFVKFKAIPDNKYSLNEGSFL
jgi:hypothetical protein